MKRVLIIAAIIISGVTGCKKYLSLDPPGALSGNNFWKTWNDVEQYTNGLYELFRQSVFRGNMRAEPGNDEFPFFAWSGDMRGAPIRQTSESYFGRTSYINPLAGNNIKSIMSSSLAGDIFTGDVFEAMRFTEWDRFYKVIAAANIEVDRINGVPDPAMSAEVKAAYKGEAVFMRCVTYFFMVRLWGDVPYYTNAYNTSALARTPMVEVLKNCVADMKIAKDGLPWTYDDPSKLGVRAMHGSAIALLMHMNMWLASFDAPNKSAYYAEVDKLGDEIQANPAYQLLPLSSTQQLFKGRTKEGLFEIPQNVNYGESFGYSAFSDNVLYYPYKNIGIKVSYIYYDRDFMTEIYPPSMVDNRKSTWYAEKYLYDGNAEGGKFMMLKFATNKFANEGSENYNPDDNQIVFRLADALLLQAEANAEMGNDAKAITMANKVRLRAGALPLTTAGDELKQDIFFERCRELMGEGQYWYDVVRTRRIIDINYKFGYHCSAEQYKAGAWTWPINESALVNNPGIVLNNYWR